MTILARTHNGRRQYRVLTAHVATTWQPSVAAAMRRHARLAAL